MKVSVSVAAEDVEFLDAYAGKHDLRSRSAAVSQAIRVLRMEDLKSAYGDAWADWDGGAEAELWDSTAGDSL